MKTSYSRNCNWRNYYSMNSLMKTSYSMSYCYNLMTNYSMSCYYNLTRNWTKNYNLTTN
jgi:hypothetical protein